MCEEIRNDCIMLYNKGMSLKDIYKVYYSTVSNASYESFKRNFRRWKIKNNGIIEEVIDPKKEYTDFELIDILKKGTTIQQFVTEYSQTESAGYEKIAEFKALGYNILELDGAISISKLVIPKENYIKNNWDGRDIIRFGLIGDTHLNSIYTQITHLHTYYDICQKFGIHKVYHAGDIDDGEQMRPGHQYECYNQGADKHVNHIIDVYPRRTQIETDFIGGNHDGSIIKRCGYDIGPSIASGRDDMRYLGQSNAIVPLTPNCKLELRHPLDGASSYALSYKTQKMIDSISGGEKPNILGIGHYHKTEYLFYRNIHGFQSGCFEAQTNWMKGKGISASLGGWIIEVVVDKDGSILEIKPMFIPFYKAIVDDYKNWIKI